MKHIKFEENILLDESYTNFGKEDKNADTKKGKGIAKNFADNLDYGELKKWYQQSPAEPQTSTTVSTEKIEEIRKEASSALHGDTLAYENKISRNGSSDQQWAKALMSKGAIGDRVAAATVLIQDNPLYNLSALRNLVNNVKPAKKKDGIVVIDALSELFISDLLIPDAKLRKFEAHPLGSIDEMTSGNRDTRKKILKLWYFEDQLKEMYEAYVDALNKYAHDTVEANKEKAVSAMSYLLMHHPEREKILLMNIINKLGDPSQSVASKVIYHLCQLLYNHPNMKAVVLDEIEKMLFRSNISPRAQYYGVCFLNQFFLQKEDTRIAESLIKIYFSFFKACIKKGDIDTRLMSAILTGVKRSYHFVDKERMTETPKHIDAIHRIVHLSSYNIAIHALSLLYHVSDASKGSADRYYTALYRKLANPDIFNTSHSALLFSLLYKSLKMDKCVKRVASFVRRLLQLSCHMTPAQACGVLFLVSQVTKEKEKKHLVKIIWEKCEIKDEEVKGENTEKEEETEKVEEETGQKEDGEAKNKIDLLHGTKEDLLNDNSEDETYVDLQIDGSGTIKPAKKKAKSVAVQSGWFHLRLGKTSEVEVKNEDGESKGRDREMEAKIQLKKSMNLEKVITCYSPLVRNPSFTGAENTVFAELRQLTQHFHPTVRLFSEKLMSGTIIQYSGDPLKDFSGARFLDRFAFKNPKKKVEQDTPHGELKKVKGSHPRFAIRKNYTASGLKSLSVNSSTYLNEDVKRIPVDERFLYDYLQKRREVTDDKKDEDSDSDNESITSEDFEKYLDNVTGIKAQDDDKSEDGDDLQNDLDFMREMEESSRQRKEKGSKKNKNSKQDEEESQEEDAASVDGGSDGSMDEDGDLLFSDEEDGEMDGSGDEDELALEGGDDDGDLIEMPGSKRKGGKNKKGKGVESLFASAEEFSTLLEDTASTEKQGSSQAYANTDNAHVKQLAWEEKRDRWMKGYNKRMHGAGGKGKGKFNKGGKFEKGQGKRKHGGQAQGGAGGKKKKYSK